jgi:outer membrane PBP1 activator LpoA protein
MTMKINFLNQSFKKNKTILTNIEKESNIILTRMEIFKANHLKNSNPPEIKKIDTTVFFIIFAGTELSLMKPTISETEKHKPPKPPLNLVKNLKKKNMRETY